MMPGEKCSLCDGISYCYHPWRSCPLKQELRLLDVLKQKQRRIEELELERCQRDARIMVLERKHQ